MNEHTHLLLYDYRTREVERRLERRRLGRHGRPRRRLRQRTAARLRALADRLEPRGTSGLAGASRR
ncbi:hypothetical protein CLV56_2188 [Mumia flava]|uniref:Uncharacterized protein n=1 Tax=Mumia flava TaxID=1348852 RepID=A0A0B2BNN1_9ACTN|nr:hypothetical protein [Mumia flava]PJJ57947.1 hypothetical protein CLV56_2188 [Mumia flava]